MGEGWITNALQSLNILSTLGCRETLEIMDGLSHLYLKPISVTIGMTQPAWDGSGLLVNRSNDKKNEC